MAVGAVNIDFALMAIAFRKHVRDKAVRHQNTIVYMKEGSLVEEDPKSNQFRVLRRLSSKTN